MKQILCIGVGIVLAFAQTAWADESDARPSNIHGWQAPPDDSHHGWGAPAPGAPETGRMTEHGWVAPTNKDCSLNHVEVEGSKQLRCMK